MDRMPATPVDPRGPVLAYRQVAADLEARIASREFAPGDRLPSERDLAGEYGCAYDTVRRATAVLRGDGLIITVHGRGTYVAVHPVED